VEAYDPAAAARRSGIDAEELNRMVELGSQEVVDASLGSPVAFRDVGPVELKGVSGARRLFAAARE